MRITLVAEIRHLCPFVDEVDNGEVAIVCEQEPGGPVLELHALRALLNEYAGERISHEDLTAELGVRLIGWASSVATRWTTAGIGVVIEAYP